MAKIYTKTGDEGKTSLLTGERVLKCHPRVTLYGQADELNSQIGLFLSLARENQFMGTAVDFLNRLQHILFDIGALLSCEKIDHKFKLREIPEDLSSEIEKIIDEMEQELTPLTNFILPGGHLLASHCHLLRTRVRSMEVELVDFTQNYEAPRGYLVLLNRLSDFFFVLSRFINKEFSAEEIIWK